MLQPKKTYKFVYFCDRINTDVGKRTRPAFETYSQRCLYSNNRTPGERSSFIENKKKTEIICDLFSRSYLFDYSFVRHIPEKWRIPQIDIFIHFED